MFARAFRWSLFAVLALLLTGFAPVSAQAATKSVVKLVAPSTHAVLSPDGTYAWYGDINAKLVRLNLKDKSSTTLVADDPVHALVSSKDGSVFASSHNSRIVRLWSQDGTPIGSVMLPALGESIALSNDGRYLATSTGQTYPIYVWDVSTQERITNYPGSFVAPKVAFIKNDWLAVTTYTGGVDSTIRIYETGIEGSIKYWTVPGLISNLAVSDDGKQLGVISQSLDSDVANTTIWEIKRGKLLANVSALNQSALTFYQKGFAIGAENSVLLFNNRYRPAGERKVEPDTHSSVTDISFDRKGKRMLVSNQSKYLTIWDRN